MASPDVSLLRKRRFGPIFAVQFLGAFNDNLLKFAILFMASFGTTALASGQAAQLAVAATGVFILPYFLFSGIAGQIADTLDKARLVRMVKAAEVTIMLVALGGFWISSFRFLRLSGWRRSPPTRKPSSMRPLGWSVRRPSSSRLFRFPWFAPRTLSHRGTGARDPPHGAAGAGGEHQSSPL